MDALSRLSGGLMVYGYIALWLVWSGLITFTAYRTEGLGEGILAAVFLISPGVIALVIRVRDVLAGRTGGGLGDLGSDRGEVAEDYTRSEMGATQDED